MIFSVLSSKIFFAIYLNQPSQYSVSFLSYYFYPKEMSHTSPPFVIITEIGNILKWSSGTSTYKTFLRCNFKVFLIVLQGKFTGCNISSGYWEGTVRKIRLYWICPVEILNISALFGIVILNATQKFINLFEIILPMYSLFLHSYTGWW